MDNRKKQLKEVNEPKKVALSIFASMFFAEDSKERTLIALDILIKELKNSKSPSVLHFEEVRKQAELL